MENYTISFKYGEKIITPKQNSTLISTEFNCLDLLNSLIENNINPEDSPNCIVIFRPNIDVKFLSTLEQMYGKRFKCPIIIKNGVEEKTFNQ